MEKRLLRLLPLNEQLKNKRFRKWRDAQNHLLGRIVVKNLISKLYNIPIEEILFEFDNYGKPYFNHIKDVHFNISHSNEWVVVVIDKQTIGIDIEEVKTLDIELAKEIFSLEEYIIFRRKSPRDKKCYFFDLWTLKESYVKAEGCGLNIPLNSFSIIKDECGISLSNVLEKRYFKQYNIDERYKLSVCSITDVFPEKVTTIDNDTYIYNFLNINH